MGISKVDYIMILRQTNKRNLYNKEARENLGHAILDHGFWMKELDMDGSLDVDFNLWYVRNDQSDQIWVKYSKGTTDSH